MYQRIAFLCLATSLFLIFWTSKTPFNNEKSTPKKSVVVSQSNTPASNNRSNPVQSDTSKPISQPTYELQAQDNRSLSQSAPMRIRFYVQNEDGTIPKKGLIKSDDCARRIRFNGQYEVEFYIEEECEFYAVRYDGLFQKHSDSVVIPYTPNGSIEQEFFFPTARTGGFGIAIEEEEEGIRVLEVYSDSPAEEQDLQYGDVIVELNGIPARELTVEEFIANGTGPEGTSVSFRLLRDDPSDEPRTIIRRALTH